MDSSLDPDYEQILHRPPERRIVEQLDAKGDAVRKINDILDDQFTTECGALEKDIYEIDRRLNDARLMLDRLRACVLISYYESSTKPQAGLHSTRRGISSTAAFVNSQVQQQGIHPVVREVIGKSVPATEQYPTILTESVPATEQYPTILTESVKSTSTELKKIPKIAGADKKCNISSFTTADSLAAVPPIKKTKIETYGDGKKKYRIVVGNVSKYLPEEMRDEHDRATHKWMMYVRGPRDRPNLENVVDKVWFFLHPSYKPNDLVELTDYPYHLTRRGWGEFPVRVQIYLKDANSRKIDVIHNLKLDRTYTGLQTLGSETHVDVEIEQKSELDEKAREEIYPVPSKPAGEKLEPDSLIAPPIKEHTITHPSPEKRMKQLINGKSVTKISTDEAHPHVASPKAVSLIKVEPKIATAKPSPVTYVVTNQVIATPTCVKKSAPTAPKAFSVVVPMKTLTAPSKQVSLLKGSPHSSISATTPKPQQQASGMGKLGQNVPVYVKFVTSDGKIMLLKKSAIDQFKPGLKPAIKPATIVYPLSDASTGTNRKSIGPQVTKIVLPSTLDSKPSNYLHTSNTTADIVTDRACAPPIQVESYPHMEQLIERLVQLDPLVKEMKRPLLTTNISKSQYLSWPLGKRRACEWNRAKRVNIRLAKLCTDSENLKSQGAWSTKRILVWCRRNLYTPMASGDSLFPGYFELANQQQTPAHTLALCKQVATSHDHVINVVKETEPKQCSIRKAHTAGDVKCTPTQEEEWIQNMTSQIGVILTSQQVGESMNLPVTHTIMFRLYCLFMETLLRRSFAADSSRTNECPGEITLQDVTKAVANNNQLHFLTDLLHEVDIKK